MIAAWSERRAIGRAAIGAITTTTYHSKMTLATDRNAFSIVPISLVAAAAIALMAALQALPEELRHELRYDRYAVGSGQPWRLLTGHFVHLGWNHLALNAAGLALGTWVFGADRTPGQWLLATAMSTVSCGLGLWWLSPEVGWCVGLSGVLHGLMVVGFGGWIIAGERSAWLLLGLVIAKLGWEQLGGNMPWDEALVGGRVIEDAHLWGALGGAAFLLGEAGWRWIRPRL